MQYLQNEWKLNASENDFEMRVVNVYPEIEHQTILGFGGAFTEAAGYNYSLMSAENKKKIIEAYFGKTGCGYKIGRIPMGSADFALAPYSETTKADLSDFNIEQDKKYIIPMVKDALKAAGDLFLFASPWTPPAFMKDTGELNHGGKLLPEFYPAYAKMFVKFIQAYRAEGINISAVTVQNEANAKQRWESCKYTAEEEAVFATNHLRPALDAAGLTDVKIIIWDHNKERLLDRARDSFAVPGADKAIWGLGYHWYSGEHFEAIDEFRRLYPEKEIFATEFCREMIGSFNEEKRNVDYATEYIESLKHGSAGLCDWNLLLDPIGGPFHWRKTPTSGCAAAFFYDAEKGELIEDGIYSAIKTVVSDIAVGDKVVMSTSAWKELLNVAVKKADGSIRLILLNTSDEERKLSVRMGKCGGEFTLPAHSLSNNQIVPAWNES